MFFMTEVMLLRIELILPRSTLARLPEPDRLVPEEGVACLIGVTSAVATDGCVTTGTGLDTTVEEGLATCS